MLLDKYTGGHGTGGVLALAYTTLTQNWDFSVRKGVVEMGCCQVH